MHYKIKLRPLGLLLLALACVLSLPACGTTLIVEAGIGGRLKDGQDWHIGIKSPPIPLPGGGGQKPEPPLPDIIPASSGPAKNPVLPLP